MQKLPLPEFYGLSVLYKTKMQNGDHLCLVFFKVYSKNVHTNYYYNNVKKNREIDLEF